MYECLWNQSLSPPTCFPFLPGILNPPPSVSTTVFSALKIQEGYCMWTEPLIISVTDLVVDNWALGFATPQVGLCSWYTSYSSISQGFPNFFWLATPLTYYCRCNSYGLLGQWLHFSITVTSYMFYGVVGYATVTCIPTAQPNFTRILRLPWLVSRASWGAVPQFGKNWQNWKNWPSDRIGMTLNFC